MTNLLLALRNVWVDPASLYVIVQIGVLAVFILVAVRAVRRSPQRLLELSSAVLFGLLLEEGDIIIFQTYRYSPFWFSFDLVPPAIALCWAMIIASAMNISDAMGIDERLAPIADAVWAIILDLALDAVAIRLGLWRWNIPLDKDWFGVPYGNFYAWLWVAASFSFFTRRVRALAAPRGGRAVLWQMGVPLAAYAGLLLAMFPYTLLQALYFREVGADWVLFWPTLAVFGLVTVFAILSRRGEARESPDVFLLGVRYLIHFYFLWALIATDLFRQIPGLLAVSFGMLALETIIAIVGGQWHLTSEVPIWSAIMLPRRRRD